MIYPIVEHAESSRFRSGGGVIFPDHPDAPSPVGPFHGVHVGLDHENAPPAAFLKILLMPRIGDFFTHKSDAFIFDNDLGLFGGDLGFDVNFFTRVETIAMLDGVLDGFFQGEANGKGAV